jgi:hypothetical protein
MFPAGSILGDNPAVFISSIGQARAARSTSE